MENQVTLEQWKKRVEAYCRGKRGFVSCVISEKQTSIECHFSDAISAAEFALSDEIRSVKRQSLDPCVVLVSVPRGESSSSR